MSDGSREDDDDDDDDRDGSAAKKQMVKKKIFTKRLDVGVPKYRNNDELLNRCYCVYLL